MGDLWIATEELTTYGHSNLGRSSPLSSSLGRSSPLLSFSRLRPSFRVNRTTWRNSIANFSLRTFPNLPPSFRANRTTRRNNIANFSFTTFPQIPFRGATQMLAGYPPRKVSNTDASQFTLGKPGVCRLGSVEFIYTCVSRADTLSKSLPTPSPRIPQSDPGPCRLR